MPTFAEWDAARKGSILPSVADTQDTYSSGGTQAGFGNSDVDRLLAEAKGTLSKADATSRAIGGGREQPTIQPATQDLTLLSKERYFDPNESPTANAMGELSRTTANAIKGAARTPIDLVKGLLGIVPAVAETAKTAVTHPVDFAKAYPDALKALASTPKAIVDPETDPEEAASLGGQLAVGGEIPSIAKGAVRATPDVASASLRGVGRATSAVGRGAEAVGTSRIANTLTKFGPLEALMRGDVKGLVAAALPKVLEAGGQGLQKLGTTVSENSSLRGLRSLIDRYLPAEAPVAPSAAETMRENVKGARADQETGFSHAQAGKMNEVPTGKEVPYRNTKPTTQQVFQSDLDAEANKLRDEGFGEGAIRKLIGKKDAKSAANFSSRVALEGLRNSANDAPQGYRLEDIARGPRVMPAGAERTKMMNAKPVPGLTRSTAMEGLRALLTSLDDASNIGRNIRRARGGE